MFSERLKKLRTEQGLTLEALAVKVDSTKSYIWELEKNNDKKPSADLVNKLAKELGTTVEYMLGADHDDKDMVFFREYKSLSDPTKKQLQGMLKVLRQGAKDDDSDS
ncbi:helix-turn-helix domain-containing protein [Thalassolituus sp. C2-1]|uniref:helix-turn-helix domain-containing protein n=1 Tax=Venatorbacter sp. C2-1 TaxID=2597518 RepID=UPI0011923B07|nr:helix-turn-helix transcriptional regulator [Thalassolituus sp. C2-1]TVV41852.1 helix-turn-helix transcriptional regulator [Thalassolituus sp. C2-1]